MIDTLPAGTGKLGPTMGHLKGGSDRVEITYVCPECGGHTIPNVSGIITLCWACGGTGSMAPDDLQSYQRRLNARAMGLAA